MKSASWVGTISSSKAIYKQHNYRYHKSHDIILYGMALAGPIYIHVPIGPCNRTSRKKVKANPLFIIQTWYISSGIRQYRSSFVLFWDFNFKSTFKIQNRLPDDISSFYFCPPKEKLEIVIKVESHVKMLQCNKHNWKIFYLYLETSIWRKVATKALL